MNGLYAEACVKKKPTITTLLAKIGLIVAVVFIFMISVVLSAGSMVGYILLLVSSVMLVALFYVLPKFNVDYEYIFCDGQLDFDLIMGGNKRKRGMQIDVENVEIMAPEKSHALDNYKNQQAKLKDYSSRDLSAKRYVLYVRQGSQLTKIIFEPNEKMISFIKQKAPRKVVEF